MDAGMLLEIKNVSKTFPGVKALDNVALTIRSGEIRALVGENGAGKSTLMKILNGNYKKDCGEITFDGQPVDIDNPTMASHLGISIIFQEVNLIESLSIAENIFASRLKQQNRPFIDWKYIYAEAKKLLDRIDFRIDPKTPVHKLSVAGKRMVEIAKALSHNARLILMDEPSSTLTEKELEELFKIIRDLKSERVSVVYISHRLEEVFEIADTVTVLRDGQIIDTKRVSEVSRDQLVEMMVGRELSNTFPPRQSTIGEEILRVENLSIKGSNKTISFNLHEGEVLGIAGLVGAGRTEAMRALYGIDYADSCDVYIRGKKVTISSPKQAKGAGLAFLTEDRKSEGVVLDFPITQNISMANLKRIVSGVFISKKKEHRLADQYVERINIKTPSIKQIVLNLSGGNQQKVVVSKWLNAEADILIMDEPTHGIDVGAKREIFELIYELVSERKAVIYVSSELPEIIGICDRVLVMKDNEITGELSGEEINSVNIMQFALG